MSLQWIDYRALIGLDVQVQAGRMDGLPPRTDEPAVAAHDREVEVEADVGTDADIDVDIDTGPDVDPDVDADRAACACPLAELDALLALAARSRMRRFDVLDVLIGFPHVHYAVAPWSQLVNSAAGRRSYARALLVERYALEQRDWIIWNDVASYGEPWLATAVDAALVAGIESVARRHRIRLRSCRALLGETLRRARLRARIPDTALLVAPQAGACGFAWRSDGGWRDAFTIAVSHTDLARQVATARVLLGVGASPLLIGASARPGALENALWLGGPHWSGGRAANAWADPLGEGV